MTKEFQLSNRLRTSVTLLLLLTPVLTNLVEHAGSTITLILTLFGIYIFYICEKKYSSRTTPISSWEKAIMGVFVLYFVFSTVFIVAHNSFNGIPIFDADIDHELRMLTFIPIYYLFIRTKPSIEAIWYSLIIAAIASGVYAFAAALATGFSDRVVGPYNPVLFGYISVALAFMSLSSYRFFYQKNKKLIILPLLGFACGLLAAFLSGTRGSVLTIPFLLIVFIFQIWPHLKIYNTKIVVGGIISVMVLLFLLFPHTRLAERFERGIEGARVYINNINCVECHEKYETAHLQLWTEALLIIKKHPFTGVGPDGYRKIVKERTENREIAPGIEIYQTPHNLYLTMLTSYGIWGFIVLMVFFLVPFASLAYSIRKNEGDENLRDIAYCGFFLIVGYMLFSMTGALFIRNILIAFYAIMLAVILSANRTAFKP